MRSALFMLLSLILMVIGIRVTLPLTELSMPAAARLIFLVVMGSALAGAMWSPSKQQTPRPTHPEPLTPASIRHKSLALRLALTALLLYPMLLSACVPTYSATEFTLDYFVVLPVLLILAPYYVRWAEQRSPHPDDDYERFGQAVLRQRPWCWTEQKALLLAWAVKITFIPLVYTWLIPSFQTLLQFNGWWNPTALVTGFFLFGITADLMVGTAGYLFASRLIGTEVRSTDDTLLGWGVCLICYPPLLPILKQLAAQADGVIWSDWLLPNEPLYWLWAALIVLSWMVYWFATMAFGLRFSNLSWRGLVDNGPYRYTKHPAYLAKNLYWWLHTVPFIGISGTSDLLRNLFGLSLVSFIYYLRAKTEERHLRRFPEYAEYAARIEREGLFARMLHPWRRHPA